MSAKFSNSGVIFSEENQPEIKQEEQPQVQSEVKKEEVYEGDWGNDPGFLRPINDDVSPIQEIISEVSASYLETTVHIDATLENETPKKRRFTQEEYDAQIEIWKKSIDGSQEAVENAEKLIEVRNKKILEKLQAKGIKGASKGLGRLSLWGRIKFFFSSKK